MKVKLTFTEPLLGTLAGDKEIAKDFIMSKHPEGVQDEEVGSLPETIEKATTYFSSNGNGDRCLWDYQIKGFFKDACSMQLRIAKVAELRAYKKIIDGLIFVTPRKIILNLPQSGEFSFIERPLRGQTAQGERIALARSETAPIGTTIEFEIVLLKKSLEKFIVNWLDYGALRGLGQWRNSGMGRFSWQRVE